MTTYAIYGFVLAFLIGLIALVVKLSKRSGYKEAELEATIARVDAIQKAAEEAKKNESNISKLSDDELIRRLSK